MHDFVPSAEKWTAKARAHFSSSRKKSDSSACGFVRSLVLGRLLLIVRLMHRLTFIIRRTCYWTNVLSFRRRKSAFSPYRHTEYSASSNCCRSVLLTATATTCVTLVCCAHKSWDVCKQSQIFRMHKWVQLAAKSFD